mgnify:FL=1|jgi:hypothetical protein
MKALSVALLGLLLTLWANTADADEHATTREDYIGVAFAIADTWVDEAKRSDRWKERMRERHYSKEKIEVTVNAIFSALADQGITDAHPLWESWLASVTANFWAQSRYRVKRFSENNVADGKTLDCTKEFDRRCDYGPLQLNGSQVYKLWRDRFGREFSPRRDLKKLSDVNIIVPLSIAYLVRQKEGKHAHSPAGLRPAATACDQVLRRPRALKKSKCSMRLKYLERLPDIEEERTVKRAKHTCRKAGCYRACHCEIMRRATGGVRGKLDTGVATAPGGSTVTAWWALRHYWPRLLVVKAKRVGMITSP